MDEIARRELTRDDGQRVTVAFHRPVDDGKGNWSCLFRIEGLDDAGPIEMRGWGVDTVGAILAALDVADTRIRGDYHHRVTWFEEFGEDLGLQTQRSWERTGEYPTDE
jgi:hypothetical protein